MGSRQQSLSRFQCVLAGSLFAAAAEKVAHLLRALSSRRASGLRQFSAPVRRAVSVDQLTAIRRDRETITFDKSPRIPYTGKDKRRAHNATNNDVFVGKHERKLSQISARADTGLVWTCSAITCCSATPHHTSLRPPFGMEHQLEQISVWHHFVGAK